MWVLISGSSLDFPQFHQCMPKQWYLATITNLRVVTPREVYHYLEIFSLQVPPTSFEVSAEPQGCYLALSWEIPSYNNCPITRYTVHYRLPNQLTKWQTTSFIAPNETLYRLKLNCSSTYEIMVLAWNERGSSIKDTKPLAVATGKGKSVMCSQSFLVFS